MSFFDDASLAFLPSSGAGKDGKAYSIKPTTGAGDFTFSRGSNLSATRVGPTGLIEKGRENLLLQSNQFDTTWFNASTTETGGQSGYDGLSGAWKIDLTGTGGYIAQAISNANVNTISVYAKAGTLNWIRLRVGISPSNSRYFDLENGVIGLSGTATIDAKIESVGSGWYRCSMTTNISFGRVYFYPAAGDGDVTASSGNIYIQDAQLEIGLAATDYIESGATTGKAGLLEDEPRFDYSGGATCPSLLLEPSRTNILRQTEYFNSSSWTNDAGTTLTTNAAISPDGSQNATRFESPLPSKGLFTYGAVNNQTISIYIKAGNTDNIGKSVNLYTTTINQSFVLTDEWQRISVSGSVSNLFALYPSSGISDLNVFIWGAQAEAGSYPTSYIPNHSGTGSVTRGKDVATILNQSGVIGQTEGTIFFDAYFDETDKINFSISDYTSSNYISIETTSVNQVIGVVRQGGSTQVTISTSAGFFAEGDRLKCAIAYNANDFAFYINGTQIGTDSSGSVPACDDIRFARYNGALAAAQKVNKTLLFDTRLSNADLTTLTTI